MDCNTTMYATDAKIVSSPYHMLITFACRIPEGMMDSEAITGFRQEAMASILLSPGHFKKLASLMPGIVEEYEKTFGAIPVATDVK